MATERVRIQPDLFELRDSSGGIKFSTDYKYLKTETPGTLELSYNSQVYVPTISMGTYGLRGHPIHVPEVNTGGTPFNVTVCYAPADGVISIPPCTVRIYITTDMSPGSLIVDQYPTSFFDVLVNDVVVASVQATSDIDGRVRPHLGTVRTRDTTTINVSAGDKVSVSGTCTYLYTPGQSVPADPSWPGGYLSYAYNFFMWYYSDQPVLPLRVTA